LSFIEVYAISRLETNSCGVQREGPQNNHTFKSISEILTVECFSSAQKTPLTVWLAQNNW
jgi:hypothetical protein